MEQEQELGLEQMESPTTELRAIDILNEMRAAEQVQPDEPDAEPAHDSQEDDAQEDEDLDEDTSDLLGTSDTDEEFDEFEVPALDPELAKDPKAVKRWEQQWNGLLKREQKLQSKEQGFEVYQTYSKAFEQPDTARQALDHLLGQLAQYHGTTREELLGIAKDISHPVDVDTADEWASEGEVRLAKQTAELNEKLSRLERETATIREERERLDRERQFNEFVEGVAPKTIKRLANDENGWKVSKEMVRTAIQKFPQLTPVDAVMAAYPKELAKHYAASVQGTKPKAPDMMPSTTRRGQQAITDPLSIRAIDILNGR